MSEIPAYTLNDGLDVPVIALGTYNLRGASGVASMVSGIEVGYRMLDSAFNYENEGALGAAVRRCGVPREDLRLVSSSPGATSATTRPSTPSKNPSCAPAWTTGTCT